MGQKSTNGRGYKATLVPYDPSRVLSDLSVSLHTPSPESSQPQGSQETWVPDTPKTVIQLQRQAEKIKKYLGRVSPPGRTHVAIDQIKKCAELVLYQAAILTDQLTQMENAKRESAKLLDHSLLLIIF
ncbi:hypothetical protein V1522DRAFT_110055 [Lipomyces starkeyi]